MNGAAKLTCSCGEVISHGERIYGTPTPDASPMGRVHAVKPRVVRGGCCKCTHRKLKKGEK